MVARAAGSAQHPRDALVRSRGQAAARQSPANARSETSVTAEIASGGNTRRPGSCGSPGSGGAASTTCALVPPKPNEFTPARRRSGATAIGSAVRDQPQPQRREVDPRAWGFAMQASRGTTPWSSASAAFSRPAIPEAGSRWPILVLTEPIGNSSRRASRARARPRRLRSDRQPVFRCRAFRNRRCRRPPPRRFGYSERSKRALRRLARQRHADRPPVRNSTRCQITAADRIAGRPAPRRAAS